MSEPVVVGAGRANQELSDPGAGRSAVALMIDAARAAFADAGPAAAVAGLVDLVAMPVGSWDGGDPGRAVARATGVPDTARTLMLSVGIPQQTLFNEAYRAIHHGAARAVLIVVGEAAARAAIARRAGVALSDEVVGGEPDERRLPVGEIVTAAEIRAGLVTPVVQYALIDSALRAAEGRTIDEHVAEIDSLWGSMRAVAGAAPPGAGRIVAFPYRTEHCSRINVDQAAAIVVCAAEHARRLGVPVDRLVHPLVALESRHAAAVVRRRDLHRWPAMECLGQAAAAHLGTPVSDIDQVEVYSCFPSAVRVQQRALGLPLDRAPTLTGGMAVAGGPWNSFVLQATVEMVRALRARPGELGMVTTVSGFLTKPGLAVFSTDRRRDLLVDDLGADAARATRLAEVVEQYDGHATVAACTVVPERSGAARTVIVAETAGGARCVGTSLDAGVAEVAMTRELVGSAVLMEGGSLRLVH